MILAIVGPTGIGKSDAAFEVCRRIPSEIVVVDSMQVYRGMSIGTGKPPVSLRREIPHHGLDLVEPEEEFDVARYAAAVRPIVEGILRKGTVPVLVGGSGLYFRALLGGLCEAPGKNPWVREDLLAKAQEKGLGFLYQELQGVDPSAAVRIHPNDLRKIVRALEVYRVSGRPLSHWHAETPSFFDGQEIRMVGLTCERDFLYRRIQDRLEGWIAHGWLDEARSLHARFLSQTAREALGYRELFGYLSGDIDWQTALALIRRNTCRYAKRQWTWFRAEPKTHWIPVNGMAPDQVAQMILEHLHASCANGTRPSR